jgi:hypothetical protein
VGLGYVNIMDPLTYSDLPAPIADYPDMKVFSVAMPHQLHCLYNILSVYMATTTGNPRNIPLGMTWHLQHCFEYLRLSLMCSGDMTLEGAETTFPKGFGGSDGWDAKHVCKDYSQIYKFLEGRRASNKVWRVGLG